MIMVPAVKKALMMGRDKKCVTKPRRKRPSTRYMMETNKETCTSQTHDDFGQDFTLESCQQQGHAKFSVYIITRKDLSLSAQMEQAHLR